MSRTIFSNRVLSAAALGGLILAGCASTTERKGEMTVAEGAEEVCRSVTVSGSILPKRICHNRATCAAIEERDEEQAKEQMREIQDRYTPVPRESGF